MGQATYQLNKSNENRTLGSFDLWDSRSTAVSSVETIRFAAERLRDVGEELGGYRVAPCANIASKSPMVDADGHVLASDVFGWPDHKSAWWRQPLVALSSPLPRACRYESEAFWCNTESCYTRQPNKLLNEIDFSKLREFAETAAVICVPIHLPFGQIGAVSFSPSDPEKSDLSEEFEAHGYIMEDLSKRFIAGYVKAMDRRNWIPTNCRLSKREVECLSWAAAGKTDQEIAMVLSRSCATVRFHIHNAAVKLDAVNRSQTVFKAAQLGFLGSVAVTSE
ncbi:MAG: helix-turn-helix transcriptional regulator [Pseudomonadota bacterium]